MTNIDIKIAQKTAAQFGLISLQQFSELGGSRAELRSHVKRGVLVSMAPRVYRVGGVSTNWRMKLMAGLLSLGPRAVISHRAAAALHGFDGFEEGVVEFTVLRPPRMSSSFATVHSVRRLDLIDRATVATVFRCTSAARTIIDLAAAGVTDIELGNAIDSAVRDGSVSPVFLRKRLQAAHGRGVVGVRFLDTQLVDSGGHSFLERQFLRLMRTAGLPRPSAQVIHSRGGATFARVDFEFAPLPLVIEVSGRRGHVTEVDRQRDAQRRNELQADGFTVIEFLKVDLDRAPDVVVETVRSAIGRLSVRV